MFATVSYASVFPIFLSDERVGSVAMKSLTLFGAISKNCKEVGHMVQEIYLVFSPIFVWIQLQFFSENNVIYKNRYDRI